MIVGKFEPTSFFQRAENVALNVAASELFGWLNRTLDLPTQWAALVTRSTGGQDVTPPGGTVEGTDAESVLFVRVTPIEVNVEQTGLAAKDGFSCDANVRLRLSIVPDRSELASFYHTVLGSRRVAQTTGLATLLQPAVGAALGQVLTQRTAGEVVESLAHDDIASAVADAVKEVCFSAGLVLDRMPVVKFDSPAFREVREAKQRAASAKAEHDAAQEVQQALAQARSEHLDHLSEALSRLKELAAASPTVALGELIRTFTERQRGEIYEALFAAEAPSGKTAWIVAAAGDELLFFRPQGDEGPGRRLRLEGPAGPARSIQTVRDPQVGPALLIGAATGVYRWPIDRAEPDLTLLVPGAPPVRGGFNSVALAGDRIFAGHSELGIWEWSRRGSQLPRRRLESLTKGATTVRALLAHGGDIFVAIDDQVVRFRPQEGPDETVQVFTGGSAAITALCAADEGVLAGNAQGDVLHWPRGTFNDPHLVHRGMNRAAESVGIIASQGVTRLVFTDTSPRVYAQVLGDSFRCEYQAGGQTLRRVDVAPDLLVATNDLRDRLFCWQPGRPSEPHGTIAVSRLCGHSIQDVCLVSSSQS